MANRTATLYIRITTSDGRKSYCKPVYQSKGRLKPQYAVVNGEPEHHKEGVYYVRFGTEGGKQQYALASKDPFVALDKLEEKNDCCTTGNGTSFLKPLSTLGFCGANRPAYREGINATQLAKLYSSRTTI